MRIAEGQLNGNNIIILEAKEQVAAEWHTSLVREDDMSETEAAKVVERYMKDKFDLSDEFIQWLSHGTDN